MDNCFPGLLRRLTPLRHIPICLPDSHPPAVSYRWQDDTLRHHQPLSATMVAPSPLQSLLHVGFSFTDVSNVSQLSMVSESLSSPPPGKILLHAQLCNRYLGMLMLLASAHFGWLYMPDSKMKSAGFTCAVVGWTLALR